MEIEERKNWKCLDCGGSLDSNSTSFCRNCKRKRNTKYYRNIGIVILILGLICGLILGNSFKISTLTYESPIDSTYNQYADTFNYIWASIVWISSLLLSIFMFAITSICYRLDLIIDNTHSSKIEKK